MTWLKILAAWCVVSVPASLIVGAWLAKVSKQYPEAQ